MIEVRYPHMRSELQHGLAGILRPIEGGRDFDARMNLLDHLIHFVYDDTTLASDPSAAIGWYLRDMSEASAVRKFVSALDAFFDRWGIEHSDESYFSNPEWLEVERLGEDLLAMLR